MATTYLLKANPLLLSQRRQHFDGNLCCLKSAKLSQSSRLASIKLKSFKKAYPSSTGKNNTAVPVVPLSFKTRTINSGSIEDPSENDMLNAIFKTLKWLKVSAAVMVHSLLLIMMVYGGDLALARSGGIMGGHSFRSSSWKSRSSSSSSKRRSSDISEDEPADSDENFSDRLGAAVIAIAILLLGFLKGLNDFKERTANIIKIQMAMLVNEPSLRADINRIAKTTDASGPTGWIRMLNGTIKSLLQHFDNAQAFYFDFEFKETPQKAEKCFKQFSNEEQTKFKEETLVNLNNMKKEKLSTQIPNQSMNTYTVVTIVIAVKGLMFAPWIHDSRSLEKFLVKLQSIHTYHEIAGVNVLWEPQEQNEMMSRDEVKENYPRLRFIL